MKKLFTTLFTAAVMALSASGSTLSAAADKPHITQKLTDNPEKKEPGFYGKEVYSSGKFTDDSEKHFTHTRIMGDVNNDDELNVADLVEYSEYLHEPRDSWRDIFNYDVNFDRDDNVFDLILLRKYLLSPDTAYRQTYAVDILETAEEKKPKTCFASNAGELTEYLASIGTDDEEIAQYLERYDDAFFAKNDVILQNYFQQYGEGIHYRPFIGGYLMLPAIDEGDDVNYSDIREFYQMIGVDPDPTGVTQYCCYTILMEEEYEMPPAIYPERNNVLLMQCSVPKHTKEESECKAIMFPFDFFGPEYKVFTYDFPDKSRQIFVATADYGFFDPDYSIYIAERNDDGTCTVYCNLNGNDYMSYSNQPFDDNGHWKKNRYGDPVFCNDETYSLTWFESGLSIHFRMMGWDYNGSFDYWETVNIYYD